MPSIAQHVSRPAASSQDTTPLAGGLVPAVAEPSGHSRPQRSEVVRSVRILLHTHPPSCPLRRWLAAVLRCHSEASGQGCIAQVRCSPLCQCARAGSLEFAPWEPHHPPCKLANADSECQLHGLKWSHRPAVRQPLPCVLSAPRSALSCAKVRW